MTFVTCNRCSNGKLLGNCPDCGRFVGLDEINAEVEFMAAFSPLNPSPEDAKAAGKVNTDPRSCTCHPDDNPPVPCARKYALSECRMAALIAQRDELVRALPSQTLVDRIVRDLEHAGCGGTAQLLREAALTANAVSAKAEKP